MPFSLDRTVERSAPARFGLLLVSGGFCYIVYYLICAIYNVYFHPLSRFPGPKSWIAFPILRHIGAARGLLDERIRTFHEKYGEVVRYAPFEVSFITADAWRDIYGHGHALQKWIYPLLPGETEERDKHIIAASGRDHARYRKALSHAFSEKGLQDQEPLIKAHVNLLIEKLKDVARSRKKTDLMEWYTLAAFDIIGDLAFGAPFDGLKNAKYHEWVALIFKNVKLLPFLRMAGDYPLIVSLAMWLMPKSLAKAKEKSDNYARDTVMKRVNDKKKHGGSDFMDSMLSHRGEKEGLSDIELISNGTVLILAGSETTATLLSGVTYWLLRTPAALRKVTDEVRSAFASEDDINFHNRTERLPYMLACLEEGLRKYPPVPSGLPRWTPRGTHTQIAGHQVPQNVSYLCKMTLHIRFVADHRLSLPDDSLSPHVGRLLVT